MAGCGNSLTKTLWSFAGQGSGVWSYIDANYSWAMDLDRPEPIKLLEMPILPPSCKVTDVRQYHLPASTHSEIVREVTDLEKRDTITHVHSLYNPPVCPVEETSGQ